MRPALLLLLLAVSASAQETADADALPVATAPDPGTGLSKSGGPATADMLGKGAVAPAVAEGAAKPLARAVADAQAPGDRIERARPERGRAAAEGTDGLIKRRGAPSRKPRKDEVR